MKARLLLICGVLAALLAVAACAAAPGPASVAVPCDTFRAQQRVSQEARIRTGQTLEVSLCANPSTGYTWGEATIGDPSILQQVDRLFVAPTAQLPGAPGSEVWTFKALRAGMATVSMDYARPGGSAEWRSPLRRRSSRQIGSTHLTRAGFVRQWEKADLVPRELGGPT